MASQGPNSGSTFTGTGGAGVGSWTSPGSAAASDNAYASRTVSDVVTSTRELNATGFGFSIPSGATINGVVVEIEKSRTSTSGSQSDLAVQLVKGGTVSGSNKAAAGDWPTTDAYTTYGTSADLWSLSLTDTDINASNFGVVIRAQSSGLSGEKGTNQIRVDHIRITVYYTEGGGGGGTVGRIVTINQAVRRASTF